MIVSASVKYAGGVFVPDGDIMLNEGANATAIYMPSEHIPPAGLPERDTRARAEALSLLDGAFEPNGKDKVRLIRACRLAWDAAWMYVKRASERQGWACDTIEDGELNMFRLGGVSIDDMSGGDIGLFQSYCAARRFYERGYGGTRVYYHRKEWQRRLGIGDVRDLARRLTRRRLRREQDGAVVAKMLPIAKRE